MKEEASSTNSGLGDAYPPEYCGLKPIEEQVRRLTEIFGLNSLWHVPVLEAMLANAARHGLPAGAEGWGVIPSVDALMEKFIPNIRGAEVRYCHATNLVLEMLDEEFSLNNYFAGRLIAENLRRNDIRKFSPDQAGCIWLAFPMQFGALRQGSSVREVRSALGQKEFGLGVFETACLLLTHPERLLGGPFVVDCVGDEFSTTQNAEPDFDSALSFGFSVGGRRFELFANTDSTRHPAYSAPTGFVV